MPLSIHSLFKTRTHRKKQRCTPFHILLFVILLFSLIAGSVGTSRAGSNPFAAVPQEQALTLFERLTPQEKVGQLFLLTFEGTQAGPGTEIQQLIANYHIGGVILTAGNFNFPEDQDQLSEIISLTRQLQINRWDAAQQSQADSTTNASFLPNFIPLFIGVQQEGDGYPYDQLLEGVTELPNPMAVGATWKPELARQIGNVLGTELSALGFNLLLGPSLDVLKNPHIEGSEDLGTRTFGGDPFWVSQMGSSYVEGLHDGSDGKLAVIAKHFPGHGGADRLPEEEVATVRTSLDELKNFELVPFFAVTENPARPDSIVEGLLSSHIRYQGFQGNIRATTRPVSLDPQANSLLMSLPQIASWRERGGIMVSDNLGSRALRRFYDVPNQSFDPIRVSRSALYAGNDLLYVADFSSSQDIDTFSGAVRTLEYFVQRYREDPQFASLVDQAVLRILTLKFKMYQAFTLSEVLANPTGVNSVGQSDQITFEVARQAATLISPSLSELDDTIPDPPNQGDRIVFISDSREVKPCSQCPAQPLIGVRTMEELLLRRYGPLAGGQGQVLPNYLLSFSIEELQKLLDGTHGESTIEQDIGRADWIIFSMLDGSRRDSAYTTLKEFLAERPDLFQQKRVVVYAFGAPYYLDSTNISKLSAYYALYSKTPSFLDAATYLLFRELRPTGALPISVTGVYDLNTALFPDPDQTISIQLDSEQQNTPQETQTPEPSSIVGYRVGDVIPLRTGMIADHNGNPVPDGTQVEFIFNMGSEVRQIETTVKGIARTTILVSNPGTLDVRAESETAKQSNVLRFEIQNDNLGPVMPLTPTEQPTFTPSPSPSPPPPTPTPTLTPGVTPSIQPLQKETQFGDWVAAAIISLTVGWVSYWLGTFIGEMRWGIRGGFLALIGGMLAYSYLALKLPGSENLFRDSVIRGVFLVTLAGTLVGIAITWAWRGIALKEKSENGPKRS